MIFSRTLLKRHSVLPGFDLALGLALLYTSLIVLIPLSAAFLKTFTLTWQHRVPLEQRAGKDHKLACTGLNAPWPQRSPGRRGHRR